MNTKTRHIRFVNEPILEEKINALMLWNAKSKTDFIRQIINKEYAKMQKK